jgi:hypothetical protein
VKSVVFTLTNIEIVDCIHSGMLPKKRNFCNFYVKIATCILKAHPFTTYLSISNAYSPGTVKLADDPVLMAKEERLLEGVIDRITESGTLCEMEMNEEKSKVM